MRLSPVVFAILSAILHSSLAAEEPAPEQRDRVIFSSGGVDSAGRRFSLAIKESFVAGAEWEAADVEGVALARVIEVAREALKTSKQDKGEKVEFTDVTLRRIGRGRIAFVKFRVGASWVISIPVNALFQTIVPEEK